MAVKLPTKRTNPEINEPKMMILYSLPKAGKTTLLSFLPSALFADYEDGTKYLDTMSVKIIGHSIPEDETKEQRELRHNKLDENGNPAPEYYLREVGTSLYKQGKPYKFLIIDTMTKFEESLLIDAGIKYKASTQGKNWEGGDILALPNGHGYGILRTVFEEFINKFENLADRIILVGHIKNTYINKDTRDVMIQELDLLGKNKNIAAAKADAIGFLYWKKGKTYISFKGSDELLCGSRTPNLRGSIIDMGTYNAESKTLEGVDWSQIYVDSLEKGTNNLKVAEETKKTSK